MAAYAALAHDPPRHRPLRTRPRPYLGVLPTSSVVAVEAAGTWAAEQAESDREAEAAIGLTPSARRVPAYGGRFSCRRIACECAYLVGDMFLSVFDIFHRSASAPRPSHTMGPIERGGPLPR